MQVRLRMQIQGSAVHCLAMQCNGRDWIAFHCIAFRRIVLHFFTARGIALHCIVVSCIAGVDHRNNMIYVNRYTTVTIYPVLPNKVCSQEGGRRRNKTNKHIDAALAASCTRSLVAARRIGYFELRPFSIGWDLKSGCRYWSLCCYLHDFAAIRHKH